LGWGRRGQAEWRRDLGTPEEADADTDRVGPAVVAERGRPDDNKRIFLHIFYFSFQIYTPILKFIIPPRRRIGPTAVTHGGSTTNRHGPR
jgi:hypothetical protein